MGERVPYGSDNLNSSRLELFLPCLFIGSRTCNCLMTPYRQMFAISFQVHNCFRVTGRGKRRSRSRVAFSVRPYNIYPGNMRDSIVTLCKCTHSENTTTRSHDSTPAHQQTANFQTPSSWSKRGVPASRHPTSLPNSHPPTYGNKQCLIVLS